MIITLKTSADELQIATVMEAAGRHENVEPRQYRFEGSDGAFCEVHLIGDTSRVPEEPFELLPGVRRVIRVSSKYRVIGRPVAVRACGWSWSVMVRCRNLSDQYSKRLTWHK